jgi:hypothetical protein
MLLMLFTAISAKANQNFEIYKLFTLSRHCKKVASEARELLGIRRTFNVQRSEER